MHPLALALDYSSGLPLIAMAGLALYIASKASVDALTAGDTNSPGRLAVAQWIPIAVVAMAAAFSGRMAIAVGLIFSTTVACLSLVVGAVALLGLTPVSAPSRRAWGMILPVGMLAFLSGFRGYLSLLNAAVLAILGVCVLLLWNDRKDPAIVPEPAPVVPIGRAMWIRSTQFILAIALAGVGAWLAIYGVDRISARSEFTSAGLLTATLVSPLLVLPIIGTGTELSHHQKGPTAVGSAMGIALLNGCLLLPLVVLGAYGRQYVSQLTPVVTSSTTSTNASVMVTSVSVTSSSPMVFAPIRFPYVVWRVDVVLWIALGLLLLPVALGRWSIGKSQGLLLMCGYAMYLAMSVLVQTYALYGLR
jgi:Ca2+/Na+ antiporter